MIREMNIRVYDEAPKPETFLVSDVSLESLKANLLVAANDPLANEDPNKNE